MINHLVGWTLKDVYSEEERTAIKIRFQASIESLIEEIDVIQSIQLDINPLSTSTVDILLISTFKSIEDLASYQIHPSHVALGDFVREVTATRTVFDYEDNQS